MKDLSKVILIFLSVITFFGCSSDDDPSEPIDTRSFTTNSDTDFFINRDGTVDIIVTGEYSEGNSLFGTVVEKGFVYGTSSNPVVNANNTIETFGPQNDITGFIENLPSGQTYNLRGYFRMDDGSYFYGNEIQASTDVDASSTRSLTMEIESTPHFISSSQITPKVNITEAIKELPVEVGVEYSLNSDFSNSTIELITDYATERTSGTLLGTSYTSIVVEGLTAATQYYFRPYAKYADNTITNAGTNSVSFTTNN